MTASKHLSESLYVGLCEEVGTRELVKMRRDIADISEVLCNNTLSYHEFITMKSGSDREGFRFEGSDIDTMYWPNDHKVIFDLSQSKKYSNLPNTTLLLMVQCEHSPPGFVLLKLITSTNKRPVRTSCVTMNDELYISSTLYREAMCPVVRADSTVHGPCASGFYGPLEYDDAHCFKCDFWPQSALPMIQRCQTWPHFLVLRHIFMSGCHLVAKGSPLSPHEDKEWRMSFSQAEQKLIYRMNHCQFLVYGLLKLFLKEVINQGVVDKLLCSYFMKTVVFWEIGLNTMPSWCPQNIVVCFWSCFKHIIHWVYKGGCPNFFIPQNNMFSGKIVGSSQQNLFNQLHGLYMQGYRCLLLSPSVRSHIVKVLYNPTVAVTFNEECLMSEVDFDMKLYTEITESDVVKSYNLHTHMKHLHAVEYLTQTPLTQYQLIFLQKLTSYIYQLIAFELHNRCRDRFSNKMMYTADRISCRLLKLAAKFGLISDMVYIAMYYYRTCRYTEALSVIEMTKSKLLQPYVMNVDIGVLKEIYTEAVRGQSWSTKMRQAAAVEIELPKHLCYINELRLEQDKSESGRIHIPPLVMLHMLSVLCYDHADTMRRQQALDNLYVLLHNDNGRYVPFHVRDISYQILGLCQEVCGDNLVHYIHTKNHSDSAHPTRYRRLHKSEYGEYCNIFIAMIDKNPPASQLI